MLFNEDFLHYIWKWRLLIDRNLHCTSAEALSIDDPGVLNTNAGPDFSFAKLRIGTTAWIGNIEIHYHSSDWLLHNHHHDQSYDSVILHAVYIDDFAIYRTDGTLIPVLILKGLVPEERIKSYLSLIAETNPFPCSRQINKVDSHTISQMVDKVIHERLEEKFAEVTAKLLLNHNNWDETFYYVMLKNFGFKINAVPFEMLADALPSSILIKHRDDPLQLAALLFGQAGFLSMAFKDKYPQQLRAEYDFLRKKYNLHPIPRSLWKFLRMRPQNFPTRRIAQLAALLLHKHHFLSLIIERTELKEFYALFKPAEINDYWKDHFRFDRTVNNTHLQFGRKSIENLIINSVCTILYSYGKSLNMSSLVEKAFSLLRRIPAERNAITEKYTEAGLCVKTAYESQSVLHLNKNYCIQKKCLNCIIGIKILNK